MAHATEGESPSIEPGLAESDSPELETRAVPQTVPDDAVEDLPPEGSSSGANQAFVEVKDPEGDHRRSQDQAKLKFAIRLVGVCIAVVIVLTGVQYGLQAALNDSTQIESAIDWLKILATTGLGFIFGRAETKAATDKAQK